MSVLDAWLIGASFGIAALMTGLFLWLVFTLARWLCRDIKAECFLWALGGVAGCEVTHWLFHLSGWTK